MATLPTPAEIMDQKKHITDDMGPSIIAANAVCYSIACIAVGLRFLSRRIARIKLEADDWLVVAGLVFTLGILICDCLGLQYGSGKHVILLTNPPAFAKMLISAEVIYNFAITAIKGSLLYLYHRVFYISRTFRIMLWITGIFVACYSIAQSFAAIFQCMPVSSNWTVGKDHYCINVDVGATIIAAFNVLTDFAILILPMPLLFRLQKPMKQKLQIMGMFLLGGFVCFASIYRCIVIHELSHSDPSWSDVRVNIWTMVELCIGILSACLPTMRPLFGYTAKKIASDSGSEKATSTNYDPSSASLALKQSRSNPAQSQSWAHLGVLGRDVEEGEAAEGGEKGVVVTKEVAMERW